MAKRKATKSKETVVDTAADTVEPMVIALAEQLGSVLGRVRRQADDWMGNEALRQQVTQIRDGATQLLERVNRATAAAGKSAKQLMPAKKSSAKKAKKSAASKPASPKRSGRGGEGRSGGVVDARGKRHRKPPPEELFDKRLGEPMGQQMGQKILRRRGRGDR